MKSETNDIYEMLDTLALPAAAQRFAELSESPELGSYTALLLLRVFFASTFSSKMQIDFLKVAWGISPVLHFLRRHSFGCRRGAVAGIQSLLVTDM